MKSMQSEMRCSRKEVDAEEIAAIVAGPESRSRRLLEGETQKLLRMEQGLHERVVGQDDAVRVVSNAVPRRAGLQDPNRPIGLFIFGSNGCR